MPAIDWTDTYLIGVPDLDADHRRLIALVNALFAVADAGATAAAVLERVDDLMAMMSPHMEREALMMAPLSGPGGIAHREKHLAGHREFTQRVEALRARLAEGGDCTTEVESLGVFLTLLELINVDYDMVGELRREGLLKD